MTLASPTRLRPGVTLPDMDEETTEYEVVRLSHPDTDDITTTGRATAQKYIDRGWSIVEERVGTPRSKKEPGSPPAVDQDDTSAKEV